MTESRDTYLHRVLPDIRLIAMMLDTVEQYIGKLEAEVELLKKQLNDDPRHWRFDWWRRAQKAEAQLEHARLDVVDVVLGDAY